METQGGFLLSQIKLISGRVFEKILVRHGVEAINGAQGKILYALWRKENVTIVELSDQTGLAPTTLTSMLDRMQESGLIERKPDDRDRRKTRILLTSMAKNLKMDFDAVSEQMNEIFYRGFSQEDVRAFEAQLNRVLENLKEELL